MHTASAPTLYALTDRTLLTLSGPQAHSFLQGQVTCDVRELSDSNSRLGAHCNPKGRMQFSFRVIALSDEQLLLQVPTPMVDVVTQSLGKYIVFSKAELAPAPELFRFFGLGGATPANTAPDILSRHWLTPAVAPGDRVSDEWGTIITLPDERYELWIKPEFVDTLLDRLAEDVAPPTEGNQPWRSFDIQAGLGTVLPETSGVFTPQALNFPALGAVSFRKGCYTGQEIVARLHYKGKLKQHLHALILPDPTGDTPAPGTPVCVVNDDGAESKNVGHVVMAARALDHHDVLVVLDDSALEQTLSIAQQRAVLISLADRKTGAES